MLQKVDSKVLKVENLTPTVKQFTLSVPETFAFKGGQFVTVDIPFAGKKVKRSYSLASSPLETGTIELCLKYVEGGPGSEFFFNLRDDDMVHFVGPLGNFTIKDEERKGDIAFIATGTGIAPFRSMIYELLSQNHQKKVFLLTGYRFEEEELYIRDKDLWKKNPHFFTATSITRPKNKDYSGETGRVQSLIDKYIPQNFEGTFFLCGLTGMIEDTATFLLKRGAKEGTIRFEKWD